MLTLLLVVACGLLSVAIVVLSSKKTATGSLAGGIENMGRSIDRVERSLRDEIGSSRRESAESAQRLTDQ